MIVNMGEYKVDLAQVGAPAELLTLMLFTLETQAQTARRAAVAYLAGGRYQRDNAQLMISTAGTVAAFVWPVDTGRAIRKAYPRRGEDLQLLLGLNENKLAALKGIRNSMMHLDERIEESYLADPKLGFSMWMTKTDPGNGRNFMSWNPETEVFSFLEHEVCVPDLCEILALIQRRAAKAFVLMLRVEDVDDDVTTDGLVARRFGLEG